MVHYCSFLTISLATLNSVPSNTMQYILHQHYDLTHTDRTAHDFELECDGIFTTLRTNGNGYYVLFYAQHVTRLVTSYESKFNKRISGLFPELFNHALRDVLRKAREEYPNKDFRVACLVDSKGNLTLHCSILPLVPASPTKVRLTRHASRTDPTVKDLEWVRQRQDMEKMICDGVNEVIMADEDGNISEGLSSNCFVITEKNGERFVYTAPDDMVLHGTMRFAAMKAHDLMPYPLKMECANCNDKIVAVGITSTSRGFLVAKELLVGDEVIPLETEELLRFSKKFEALLNTNFSYHFQ